MTREEAKEILTHNWTRVDNPNYAVDMDITWRYCYMLHGRALAEFEKVLNG